jgi:hypothetical protein
MVQRNEKYKWQNRAEHFEMLQRKRWTQQLRDSAVAFGKSGIVAFKENALSFGSAVSRARPGDVL